MKIKVIVTLKEEVFDAPGRAVAERLNKAGYGEVRAARVGQVIELDLDTVDREGAVDRIQSMCKQVLANAVVEDFSISLE